MFDRDVENPSVPIEGEEKRIEKKDAIIKLVDPILKEMDEIIPPQWNRNQVAAVFSVYLELYR